MDSLEQYGIGTGTGALLPPIAGRLGAGEKLRYVLAEEPGLPILMHWVGGKLQPHYTRRSCPHCRGQGEAPKPMVYVGGYETDGMPVIVEITWRCFQRLQAAACTVGRPPARDLFETVAPVFLGLAVEIARANFAKSPRVLQCRCRVGIHVPWPYDTRRELMRIWKVVPGLRLYREEKQA